MLTYLKKREKCRKLKKKLKKELILKALYFSSFAQDTNFFVKETYHNNTNRHDLLLLFYSKDMLNKYNYMHKRKRNTKKDMSMQEK